MDSQEEEREKFGLTKITHENNNMRQTLFFPHINQKLYSDNNSITILYTYYIIYNMSI